MISVLSSCLKLCLKIVKQLLDAGDVNKSFNYEYFYIYLRTALLTGFSQTFYCFETEAFSERFRHSPVANDLIAKAK